MKYNKDKKNCLLKEVELCPLGLPDRKLCYKNSVDMQKCLERLVYVIGVMSLSFITSIYIAIVLNKEIDVKQEKRLIAEKLESKFDNCYIKSFTGMIDVCVI